MKVVSVIVTYNPNRGRFERVLSAAAEQTDYVVVVDNGSGSRQFIERLCGNLGNCDFVEVGYNSGVARALKVGVGRALRYDPDWLLFLDHDALLLGGAVEKALEVVDRLPPGVRGRVGAAFLGSAGGDCSVRGYRYGWFSGTLIRADIASKVCCRDDFFIDQADHDMYARVRELGYLTVLVNCRLVDRELGSKRWIRFLGRVEYEPPWRYYYIVRNSTKLLIEGRMDLLTYVKQLRYWGVRILLADGVKAFAKPLALGLMHALLGRLGYMDRRFLEK